MNAQSGLSVTTLHSKAFRFASSSHCGSLRPTGAAQVREPSYQAGCNQTTRRRPHTPQRNILQELRSWSSPALTNCQLGLLRQPHPSQPHQTSSIGLSYLAACTHVRIMPPPMATQYRSEASQDKYIPSPTYRHTDNISNGTCPVALSSTRNKPPPIDPHVIR